MQTGIKRDFRGGKDAPTTVANSVVLSPVSFSHALSPSATPCRSVAPPGALLLLATDQANAAHTWICLAPTNPDETYTFPFY